jgi:hypothetical protein
MCTAFERTLLFGLNALKWRGTLLAYMISREQKWKESIWCCLARVLLGQGSLWEKKIHASFKSTAAPRTC